MSLGLPKRQAENVVQLAQQLVRADRYDTALRVLSQAIEQQPTARLYDDRGIILSLIVRNEEARESFSMALHLATKAPERATIYFHRGLLYGRDQLYQQALQDFAHACCLNPFEARYREAHTYALECCRLDEHPPEA